MYGILIPKEVIPLTTEAQKKARREYDKQCRRLVVTIYPSEPDIMEKINGVEHYVPYIKGLIRADIAKNG